MAILSIELIVGVVNFSEIQVINQLVLSRQEQNG